MNVHVGEARQQRSPRQIHRAGVFHLWGQTSTNCHDRGALNMHPTIGNCRSACAVDQESARQEQRALLHGWSAGGQGRRRHDECGKCCAPDVICHEITT